MCTRPILIRNKKLSSLGVTLRNSFIKVPCGNCDECLRKRAKDLYVRSRFVIENAALSGGTSFMCCLTYGLNKAPYFLFGDKKYYCFNKKHVQDFIKRLRINLDRFFNKYYFTDAPDFKYLVTSEFGTSEFGYHLPHYHLLFSFEKSVSLYVFKLCFHRSLSSRGKSVFGSRYQCDLFDMSRGGARYTSKYVLKDQNFSFQNRYINQQIKKATAYVNQKYGIIEFPATEDDYFKNKCIRCSKVYRKDVSEHVTPYRHMLQFYMCSNDFGFTEIYKRYGDNLFRMGMLSLDAFPYSIPKSVITRCERVFGSHKRDEISKNLFISQLRSALDYAVYKNYITSARSAELLAIGDKFIIPRFGSLYFVNNDSLHFVSSLSVPSSSLNEDYRLYEYYDNNDLFQARNDIISVLNFSNNQELLEVRASSAHKKSDAEKRNYQKKKLNKGYAI